MNLDLDSRSHKCLCHLSHEVFNLDRIWYTVEICKLMLNLLAQMIFKGENGADVIL